MISVSNRSSLHTSCHTHQQYFKSKRGAEWSGLLYEIFSSTAALNDHKLDQQTPPAMDIADRGLRSESKHL